MTTLTTLLCLLFFTNSAYAITLEDALKSALAKNETVGQAQERTNQSEDQLNQLKSGPMPTLKLEAVRFQQPENTNPLYREFSPQVQESVYVSLNQPLFRGFREFAAIRQGRNRLEATRLREVNALADLYENVATIYLQILSFERELVNLGEQRDIYAARVTSLQARAKRGESALNEPLTAQSTEAATIAAMELTRTRLHTARETFSFLTGLPSNSAFADDSLNLDAPVKLESLQYYLKRLERRPDVRAAQEDYDAAQEEVSIQRRAHWPSIDATGNYYFKRPEGFVEDIDWDFQIKLTLPLFEGGLTMARTREAESKKREAELELRRVVRGADTQIRTLYETMRLHSRNLEALKRAVELSKKNSEYLQRDFRRGLARNIDVQNAVAEHGEIRRTYDNARFAASFDLIRFKRSAHILPAPILAATNRENE